MTFNHAVLLRLWEPEQLRWDPANANTPTQQRDMLQMIAPSGIISSYPPSHLISLVRCPEQAQRRCYQVNIISSAVEVEGFFCI